MIGPRSGVTTVAVVERSEATDEARPGQDRSSRVSGDTWETGTGAEVPPRRGHFTNHDAQPFSFAKRSGGLESFRVDQRFSKAG